MLDDDKLNMIGAALSAAIREDGLAADAHALAEFGGEPGVAVAALVAVGEVARHTKTAPADWRVSLGLDDTAPAGGRCVTGILQHASNGMVATLAMCTDGSDGEAWIDDDPPRPVFAW